MSLTVVNECPECHCKDFVKFCFVYHNCNGEKDFDASPLKSHFVYYCANGHLFYKDGEVLNK